MTLGMTQHNTPAPMTGEALQQKLAEALPGADVTLRDDTHKHEAHNHEVDNHGSHFFVRVVWDGFKDMPRLQRHKMVHDKLAKEWSTKQIHSLSLRLMTQDEASG
jgi:BolA protein